MRAVDVAFWLVTLLALTLLMLNRLEADPTPESMLPLRAPLGIYTEADPCLCDFPPEALDYFFNISYDMAILEKCFPVQIDHSGV